MTNDKIIIYDDDCPLCQAYTAAFVKTRFINEAGRKNFSNINDEIFSLIDKTKCNNEIPLIDIRTNQVWYGIDALLEILNEKIPFIKSIGNMRPVNWFLKRLYKFISYNRKVIVAKQPKQNEYDCSPSFNLKYRLFFLLVFLCFNSLILIPFYENIFSNSFISSSSLVQLQLAHFLFVSINILVSFCFKKEQQLEYLGQVNMLALITILLIFPLYFMNIFTGLNHASLNNFYLGAVTVFIIKEFFRRMKYTGIFDNYKKILYFNAICLSGFILYLSL
ncbi:MAG: DCC1-like thiol-disulfide oxidoreductase family protein [Ferruginibacter sp.]